MRPGARLVVSHLSKKFGTSAMPVRQALQRLVAENALNEHPNRGVRVPVLDALDLMDLRRVRCAIEGQATEWAAQTVTGAELEKLAQLQTKMLATTDASHAENYLAWNMEFHFTVYGAARSPLLIPVIEGLWLRVGPCLNIMRTETTLGLGLDHHDEVLDALARGDGIAARRVVEGELSEAAEIMIRSLGRISGTPARKAKSPSQRLGV